MIDRGRLRLFLITLAVVGVPLGVLAMAGAGVAVREVDRAREARSAQTVGTVAAVVAEAQDGLRREARVLARDPALVEAASRGDWGVLARWGSPRILALTREGIADVVVVRDARNAPLLQVPPLAKLALPTGPAPIEPRVGLALVDGRPYLLATAALWTPALGEGATAGTVAMGRRIEGLARALDALPGSPALVVLSGDRAVASTRAGEPDGGWPSAVRAGRASIGGEAFVLRPLAGAVGAPADAALWALAPESGSAASVRRLWAWAVALSVGGAVILALGVGVILSGVGRVRGRPAESPLDAAPTPVAEAPAAPVPASTAAPSADAEARALAEITAILESSLEPKRLLKQVAIATARACRVDRCSIERWDGDHVIPLMSQYADGRRDPRRWSAFIGTPNEAPRDVPAHVRAIVTRRPVVIPDVRTTDLIPRQWVETFGFQSFMVVPLIRQDEVIGVMTLDCLECVGEFAPWQERLAAAIAARIALSVENARLFEDNRRRVEELSVLHEMSRAVTGRLDLAGLLDTIQQQLARLLDARHLVILLLDEPARRVDVALRVVDGTRRDTEPHSYPLERGGLSRIVIETGRPIRTADYLGECARRGVEPVPESAELPHWLGVAMAAGDQRLGVLALRSRDRAYTGADERLLASIADLAALALRSARLYADATRAHAELAAAQDQLVRTEKLRAMGEMASGVAHDFNNVLSSILGRAQLLLERVDDSTMRQWLLVIERAASDGARTVRRLQEFTRVRRDQPAEPVDLNRVVQETLEATEPSWRQDALRRGAAIAVETALAPSLPRVSGDAAELREALTNLVLNAVDAMPTGGRLRVETRATAAGVELDVADTGAGIPESIRERIFDPFFTTKGPRGTGLGLSMTYGILARHDGRITVESAEGAGTTFHIVFPVGAVEPDAPLESGAPAPVERAPLACLVVDDEAAVAEVLRDMIEAIGHEATCVATGAAALDRLRAARVDVLLTDLAMPEMTGWDLAREAKRIAPEMPVFLVTGFGAEVTPADLARHGVDLVLAKPLKIGDVRAALAQVSPRAGGTA